MNTEKRKNFLRWKVRCSQSNHLLQQSLQTIFTLSPGTRNSDCLDQGDPISFSKSHLLHEVREGIDLMEKIGRTTSSGFWTTADCV